jgi:hypothetical protein
LVAKALVKIFCLILQEIMQLSHPAGNPAASCSLVRLQEIVHLQEIMQLSQPAGNHAPA